MTRQLISLKINWESLENELYNNQDECHAHEFRVANHESEISLMYVPLSSSLITPLEQAEYDILILQDVSM